MIAFFRSVKFRLTLWYAFILTVLLSLFAWLMYSELARTLYEDTDRILLQQALSVQRSLHQHLESSEEFQSGLTEDIAMNQERLLSAIKQWEHREQYLKRALFMIRILRYDKSLMISNLKGWEKDIIFPNFERDSIFMETGSSFQTIHFRDRPVRLYYHLVDLKATLRFVIQTGAPIHEVERTLSRLVFIIWIWIPAAVAVAGVAGWFLAQRSLRPIDSMIGEARQITAAYLKGRLPRTRAGDELDKLAETLNEMMDRIASSTQAVQEFSSNVSHELKTPLAIIRGEIDLALRKSRTAQDLLETLKIIGEEVNGLIRLVDDLMLLVRSDSKQLRLEMKTVSLGEVLDYVRERFRERAQKKRIDLRCHYEHDAEVTGDEIYLKRLFSNLVDNAIKFTDDGGWVHIALTRVQSNAVISVSDNGTGIEEEIQTKVFSRFYRTDQARTQEGAGLGLNIAKAITDAHQGTLSLRSQVGEGTTVSVILSLVQSQP